LVVEVGLDGLAEVVEHGSFLLGTHGDGGPDAFARLSATLASGALGDAAVDGHQADGLFGEVVGRFDARRGQEAK